MDYHGISLLENIEDGDTNSITASPITPTRPVGIPIPLPRFKLKVSGLITEYVIITTRALESAVEPLLAAKKGWPHYAKVALTEDIRTEFPSSSLKSSIKAFIAWVTDNWRVPPRFVVLAGDSDVIPMHVYDRGEETYASDHYYSDISGDLVPELMVSRIPTSNASQLKSVCRHLVRYGSLRKGDWGGWQNRIMMCADVHSSSTYETTCDGIYDKIKSRYSTIKRYAKNTEKNDVVNTMNSGVVIALYRGHGLKTEWSSSNGLNRTDVSALKNGSRPPLRVECLLSKWLGR